MINLKAAAVMAGVKGIDVAERFGVAPQTASKWINRLAPVPDRCKAGFAKMLGVTLDDLLPEPTTEQGLNHATSEGLEEQELQAEGGERG